VEYGGNYWLSGDYEDINRAMIAEGEAFYSPSLLGPTAHRRQEAADIKLPAAASVGLSMEFPRKRSEDRAEPIVPTGPKAPKGQQELLPYGLIGRGLARCTDVRIRKRSILAVRKSCANDK